MSSLSHGQVNMDGSDDPFYRYQMPALLVKVEGTSKMRKSVLVNLVDVCRKVGRPPEHLIVYLGQSLNAACKIEKDTGKAYVTGVHSATDLQSCVLKFIRETVMCHHCHNPETSCYIEGKKKSKVLYLCCKACQKRSDLDPTDRFVKFMMQHLPPECMHGHAGSSGAAPAKPLDLSEEPADARPQNTHKEKMVCPKCGHKTSKAECRKCGMSIVVEDVPLLEEEGHADSHNIETDDGMGLYSSISRWMATQDGASTTSAEDLHDWLISQGHIHAKLPEKLSVVVQAATKEACAVCDFETGKLQPKVVASQVQPTMQKWQPLIEQLHDKVGDEVVATKAVVCAVQMIKDSAMVGILLCLRELVDGIDDCDLALACRSLPNHCLSLEQFIKWLEEDDPDRDA